MANARDLGFDEARLARVKRQLESDIEAERCHGASIIVARRGQVVLEHVLGHADRKSGRKLGPDAVFTSLSVGKQYTTALVLGLVERGALALHAPVASVIPEFGKLGKERVTLYQLLTQTSGLQSAIPTVPPEVLMNIEKLTDYACRSALESLPGARVNYSIVLAHSVVAAMALRADGRGRTFARMLDDDLFQPLGMRDTALGARDDLVARWCPIRSAYKDAGLFDPAALEGIQQLIALPGAEMPAGGFLTTVRDMHRFAEMLRRGGELDGVRVLSPATIDYATRNQTGERPNELWNYTTGFRGWDVFPAYLGIGFFLRGEKPTPGPFGALNSPRTFGGIGAGSTAFWIDPERELTFAFASTGLMEDSFHVERVARLSDQVVSSIVA
ncbi:MAG TPA: serine hydrolase domain-containing protein [Myxococcota bacterium]|nr:serine hydrolase domain-containing protein [Myxococcota bacterium]